MPEGSRYFKSMYLINVHSMKIEFFQDERSIKYAILSHRWQEEEVSFQDMQTRYADRKIGYAKIKRFCKEVAASGYSYAWCDTCCIDKSSSAELSESINSMFRWYRNAAVCYAYLFDVTTATVEDAGSAFANVTWFTRGWCLQELLAPVALRFFNRNWKSLGTREDLSETIAEITGIHKEAICGQNLDAYTVAQKMSWAADRQTTRVEDMAYSLMGLFGVNMPLLYGEGEKAFIRLQQEILKQSSDHSILIHSSDDPGQALFAASPSDFRGSAHVVHSKNRLIGEPYSLTNVGLSIEVLLYPWSLDTYIALLDCRDERGPNDHIGIFVRLQRQLIHHTQTSATDHAVRVKVNDQSWTSHLRIKHLPYAQARIYIEDKHSGKLDLPPKRYGYWIRSFGEKNNHAKRGKLWAITWNKWNSADRVVEQPNGRNVTTAIVVWEDNDPQSPFTVSMLLAFSKRFEPIIELSSTYKWPADVQSKKEFHLTNMNWISRSARGNNIFLRARGRDLPVREISKWGMASGIKLLCQKQLVKGVETWVVDVTWFMGKEYFSELFGRAPARVICDACLTVGYSFPIFYSNLDVSLEPAQGKLNRYQAWYRDC